jgi:uncharacterized protein YjbI with pentapeptide repeats
MANPEHLEILRRGVKGWNEWRKEYPQVKPDLVGSDLTSRDFCDADFHDVDAKAVNFAGTNLQRANLSHASLHFARLLGTDLRNSTLRESYLIGTYILDAKLSGADFTGASFGRSILDTDLSNMIGLEKATHSAPSTINISSIYRSQGIIPESFLRGAGVPENFITYMKSLTASAFEFYSAFISYSTKNQDAADRIHADLQARGVRCWLATEDLKIGDPFRQRIDESIKLHDKLLLILSEHSVQSPWVQDEVEAAVERERRDQRLVLFPIRIDDAVMDTDAAWAASIRRTRHIGDFTRWKDHDAYQKAFERLLRDLKDESKAKDKEAGR